MKKKLSWLISVIVIMLLSLGLLAGCGGSTANASDFYGCWEYETVDTWVVFNEDSTYDWYYDDGYGIYGEFTVEDGTLTMTDDGMTFSFDDDGGLVDSNGDALFASELPDFTSAFIGCWEYETLDIWVIFYEDGTYDCYQDDSWISGTFTMDVNTLVTDADLSFNSDGVGGLIDSDGDALFASSISGSSDSGDYGDSDSSEAEVTGLESELVGDWYNSETEDLITFYEDGSVSYALSGTYGYASPYTYDGYNVTFSDYTGYVDSDGDLNINGVSHWFTYGASTYTGSDETYSIGGAYDNDSASTSLVFSSDGTFERTTPDSYIGGEYIIYDDGTLYMETYDSIETGEYDSGNDTIYVDGEAGYYYWVDEAYYTPY